MKEVLCRLKRFIFIILFNIISYLTLIGNLKVRKFILFILDFICLFLACCLWLLLIEDNISIQKILSLNINLVICITSLSLIIYLITGQYKGLTRYMGSMVLYSIFYRNFLSLILFIFLNSYFDFYDLNFKGYFLLYLILNGFVSLFKFLCRDILINFIDKNNLDSKQKKVAIYGAGSAGAQLAASLRFARQYKLLFFLDDSKKYQSRNLFGIPIIDPSKIDYLDYKIDLILIAIANITNERRREIISFLQKKKISVLQIPTLKELTSGSAKISSLRKIDIQDLLGRPTVYPNKYLLDKGIQNTCVLVTGGGGSIGSEICRQIQKLSPKKLVIVDSSEPSLYLISQEFRENNVLQNITPILGDITDFNFVEKILKHHNVEIIFHAAAYKHVPLLEKNPLQAIKNNVFSTLTLCKASLKHNVKKLILVSTDKAVRPTNVMGASKRLAELIVQSYAEVIDKKFHQNKKTLYGIVRFGNVLNSSGSVVKLFQKQILNGGPITLTHEDITRYFMTITEASQLVIQSSVLLEGGDVFLLDMGKPVKIKNLAEQMIRLNGLSIKNSENLNGDIEIEYIGLRPGEKLYEELLIDKKSEKTLHPLIFKAFEKAIPYDILENKLISLKQLIKTYNKKESLDILHELVPEWNRKI